MSIEFLKQHTQSIPVDSPLRHKFDTAMIEIEEMEAKLGKLQETTTKEKSSGKTKER